MEYDLIYLFTQHGLTQSAPQGSLASCFPHGVTCPDCIAQEVVQLFLQHVTLNTPYVNTAKNRNFHNKFSLSFNSTIFSFY